MALPLSLLLLKYSCGVLVIERRPGEAQQEMNHDALRACLKSALLFAIPIGLLAVFAQPSGSHPENQADSIVVFAPHPDDEVIGCAGIIMQALARGARVKVVAITSGDGFPAAAA